MLCLHIERKHIVTLLNDIIYQNISLHSDSNIKAKTNDQRDKKIYVDAILFNSFEFSSIEIENLINVKN